MNYQFSCSAVSDSTTPWTTTCQASLSITNTQRVLKLMSISQRCHPPYHPLPSPSPPAFNLSQQQGIFQWVFTLGAQSIGTSASTTVLPMTQFSSVPQSCPTLCKPMNCSMPGLPVHHQLPDFTLTYVHWVGDAIQPSHPLPSPSPPAPNLSKHQGLFQWVNSLHEVAKVLEFQLQHQSFQWTPKTDLL